MLGDSLIQPNHKKCKISVYLRGGLKLLLGTVYIYIYNKEKEALLHSYTCMHVCDIILRKNLLEHTTPASSSWSQL